MTIWKGKRPALTPEQAAQARHIVKRRRELRAQIAAARAELESLPKRSDLAERFGVDAGTITDYARALPKRYEREVA